MIEDATKPIAPKDNVRLEPHMTPELNVESTGNLTFLDLKEAAFLLGKSMRSLERSLTGKWGNKLPDGWSARRTIENGSEEWKIVPPPGFNLEPLYEHKRQENPQTNLALPDLTPRRWLQLWKKENETEKLIEELAAAHQALAEERRAHIEDLRMLKEAQSSLKLIESKVNETALIKAELIEAQKDLVTLKDEYQRLATMPWWKKLFSR